MSGVVITCNYVRPRPEYPAFARGARITGAVEVQVVVDERGDVTSAQAVSGPPLLYAAAAKAAKETRFLPTFEGHKPVKVSGVLTYNFVLR